MTFAVTASERSIAMSKHDIEVTDVYVSKDFIRIYWAGNTGFGTYDLCFENGEICGYSERMDKGDDKSFLKEVLNALAEKVEVKE